MAELVRIKSVVHGKGKATITLELDIDDFWEDQFTRNKELRVAKRPLLAALENDSVHGPYVSLLPAFAKVNVENLESHVEEQFRKHNPPQAIRLDLEGLDKFVKEYKIVANPHDKPPHYGFEHLPSMRVQRMPNLVEFCKERGIEIKETKNGDVGEGDGVI